MVDGSSEMDACVAVVNPATGNVLDVVAADSAASVAAKVRAAALAQPAWAARSVAERVAVLARFRDLVVAAQERLATLLTSEMGKPIAQARSEIAALAPRIDFFLKEVPKLSEAEVVSTALQAGDIEEVIRYEPIGVVAHISAWNYPYFVGSNVFVPALLTGNAVAYKPSELTPKTGLALAELLHEAGVPAAVFVPLIGNGRVGSALLAQPVNAVCFTGSHATGQRVSAAVAGKLLGPLGGRLQLELGGKDPAYVCHDADPVRAATALADGSFYNTGQSCCSVERIYVHAACAEAFIEHFVETVRAFRIGDPLDPETYIGPLAREAQLRELELQVEDALALGATLRLGGRARPGTGYYFEPTVLTDVLPSMRVMQQESFGPIIGIQVVADDEEAIALMNASAYGLTASVYSTDRARAESILARVSSGTAYWNCCDRVSPRLPWSGRNASGMGATLGHAGIRAFQCPKAYQLKRP